MSINVINVRCRKIMVLTAAARASYSRGFIYNLVTSDADNVQMMCNQIFTLLSSPIRICRRHGAAVRAAGHRCVCRARPPDLCDPDPGCASFQHHDCSAIAAIACAIVDAEKYPTSAPSFLASCVHSKRCIPHIVDVHVRNIAVQMKITRWASQILNRGMAQADERTKLESDLVTGVEAVKTQAWEAFFMQRITLIRAHELSILWKSFKLSALNTLVLQTVPTLVTIATFAMYVLLGNTLTANKAFTSLSLFSVLRFPLFQLPMVVSQAVRASVAFGRLKVRGARVRFC